MCTLSCVNILARFRDVPRVPEEEDACCPCMCKSAEVAISTETRYIKEKCEKMHRSIRAKTVSGKRFVYCVTLRDSCITANGGETDLDEST